MLDASWINSTAYRLADLRLLWSPCPSSPASCNASLPSARARRIRRTPSSAGRCACGSRTSTCPCRAEERQDARRRYRGQVGQRGMRDQRRVHRRVRQCGAHRRAPRRLRARRRPPLERLAQQLVRRLKQPHLGAACRGTDRAGAQAACGRSAPAAASYGWCRGSVQLLELDEADEAGTNRQGVGVNLELVKTLRSSAIWCPDGLLFFLRLVSPLVSVCVCVCVCVCV